MVYVHPSASESGPLVSIFAFSGEFMHVLMHYHNYSILPTLFCSHIL